LAKLSAKLRSTQDGFAHWCPGCEQHHGFYVANAGPGGAIWTFDGNVDRPTFAPSMVVNYEAYQDEGISVGAERCHYWLRSGAIEFLNDCTHQLKGLTITLPDLP
jgi:hypothetical protein